MARLFEIHFDNSHRLTRKRYLLEYGGVRFKLVQDNPRKWANHLLTIIPDNDRTAHDHAFRSAAEFLSALAWENRARVMLWEAGSRSWPASYSLNQAVPSQFGPPRLPFDTISGCDLTRIPKIDTPEQRLALALFREANAANNDFLAFLFFWQVLEVGRGSAPIGFINKALRRDRSALALGELSRLPLAGRSLGDHLYDECRNAVAHVRPRAGRRPLDVDDLADRQRFAISTQAIKVLAAHYIRKRLGLTKTLFLRRHRRGGPPVYVDPDASDAHLYCPLPIRRRSSARRGR